MSSVLCARTTSIYQVEMDVKNEANVEIDCPETAIEHKKSTCHFPFALRLSPPVFQCQTLANRRSQIRFITQIYMQMHRVSVWRQDVAPR